MKNFSMRRKLLFAGGAVSLLLVTLVLLPKLGFDLPGFLKSPGGLLRTQVGNAGALAGKGIAWWDSFRENYRIKARRPETELMKEPARQLNEKFGVNVDYPSKVSSWGWGYAEGYNSVALHTLDDKFQRDVAKEFLQTDFANVIPKAGDR
ncbi:MAG: hypothetical protein MOB07_01300 [Acidobacteria bacterium]|nr:hypothetical protein [Acidobacteriota bacterium]